MRGPRAHRRGHPGTAARPPFGSLRWRLGNALVVPFARLGVGPIHLLTTDRPSGDRHTVPVVPVHEGGGLWLVAPYGPVPWVHDVRRTGRARLRHGTTSGTYAAREVDAGEAGPVLRSYVQVARKTRPHFDAPADAPAAAFAAEARRHPVFALVPVSD